MNKISIAVLVLLVPCAAAADSLTDVRAALTQLMATAPVHGSLEVTYTSKSNEDANPDNGKAAVTFEATEAGLRILYPRPVLAQASLEARSEAVDPDRPSPA